ncbi:porin family protein [Dysgonomonas sp. 520]|uniref:porin family protein n=1 Tax=Dysgonomonas sp. 520 TaxID=2302931 RepID=UPI0013D4F39B|nr:porin family protein [Dysgonomonas sp. 520]NDW09123.1 PorT family protein [Dysgonomonas sp. 520]
MKESRDDIKDIFSSKLQSFEADVPGDLWLRIENDLPKKKIFLPKRTLAKVASIAAGIVAAVAMTVAVINFDLFNYKQDDATTIHSKVPVVAPETVEEEPVVAQQRYIARRKKVMPIQLAAKEEVEKIIPKIEEPEVKPAKKSFYKRADKIGNIAKADVPANGMKRKESFYRISPYYQFEEHSPKKEKKEKGLSKYNFDVNVLGFIPFNKETEQFPMAKYIHSMTGENNIVDGISNLKMKHNQPVSFGLGIGKRFTPKLSLQTGLVYTYLYSKGNTPIGSDLEATATQKFHYLGVPLFLNYDLKQWNKGRLYISAGGMIQKDIHGKFKVKRNVNDLSNTDTYISKSIHQDNPQFSVSTSLGFSYPVYDNIFIYSSLGGAYYFDINNPYKTIYTDKEFHLDLNVGLKFEF